MEWGEQRELVENVFKKLPIIRINVAGIAIKANAKFFAFCVVSDETALQFISMKIVF